jgi:ABC-type anion transport system duplicated permease subunit
VRRRLVEIVKGLTSVVAAVAALVGPPLALVSFVGNPLPHRIPAWSEVTDAIARQGVSDSVMVGILAVLAWIIWVQIAAAIVVEAVAVVRGVPAIRLPLLPGVQSLAAYWFAAAALIVSPLSDESARTATSPRRIDRGGPCAGERRDFRRAL